ncbi:MAG: CPBP family intramembrane glutamic endopeptidase [Chloroflexota bacterium]
MSERPHRGLSALFWLGLLFLPGLPAYLWLFPAVNGTAAEHWLGVAIFFYFLGGALLIARGRWSLAELGVNGRGLALSLGAGLAFGLAVLVGTMGTNLPLASRPPDPWLLAGDALLFFGLVGPIEELLFRGLLYRALLDWRGLRWAILGSALAFGVYHYGRSGLLAALGIAVVGLVWGLIRWRAGGVVGLMLVHGAADTLAHALWPEAATAPVDSWYVTNHFFVLLGDALLLALILYLWRPHFLFDRRS